jgi:hypothetical protein
MLQIRSSDILNFYQAANAMGGENTAPESIRNRLGAYSRTEQDKVSLSAKSKALSHESTIILKALTEAPKTRRDKLAATETKHRKGFYNTHDVAAKLAEKLISSYPRVKNEEQGLTPGH